MQKMSWWQKVLYALALGTPCFFLSEGFFWARWRLDFNPLSSLVTWLVYCFVTYTTLLILDRFKVRNFWGVFLAGAVYGWLLEAVVVSTFYEDFPLGISFTGLAWHAPLSVGVGLYALPRLLRQAKPGRIAWMSAIAGLVYALWAIWWWGEEPGNINPPLPWLLYSGGMTVLSMLGLWAADRFSRAQRFVSTRGEWIAVVILWSLFFLFVRFFSYGWGIFVLPLLMLLTFIALRQGQKKAGDHQQQVLEAIRGPLPLSNLLALLALPATAALFYTLAYFLGLQFPSHYLFYAILTPAGFVLYILAIVQLMRRKRTIKKPAHSTISKGE